MTIKQIGNKDMKACYCKACELHMKFYNITRT